MESLSHWRTLSGSDPACWAQASRPRTKHVGRTATHEWIILNKSLHRPALRVRRADPRPPLNARAAFRRALLAYGNRFGEASQHSFSRSFPYTNFALAKSGFSASAQGNAQTNHSLKADIFRRKLQDVKQQYEALSYCGGTDAATHEIQIRDLNAAGAPTFRRDPGTRSYRVQSEPCQEAARAVNQSNSKSGRTSSTLWRGFGAGMRMFTFGWTPYASIIVEMGLARKRSRFL